MRKIEQKGKDEEIPYLWTIYCQHLPHADNIQGENEE